MRNIKITAFYAVIFIICLSFSACSQNDTNINSDRDRNNESDRFPADIDEKDSVLDSIPAAELYYDILGERDFEGAVFTILDANDHPDFHKNISESMNGDPLNDALYLRDRFIEEKYGVDIKYIQITKASNGCAALEKSVLAGENPYDLVVSPVLGGSLARISTQNILYNMTDAPYLSLTSPWWSKLFYENMQFNNRLYYNGGDIFLPSYAQGPAMMAFNKKLFKDRGIQENLYEMAFEGKWTFDVLERLIKDTNVDLNQDGRMTAEHDFFGMIHVNHSLHIGFFFAAAGMKYSESTGESININLKSDIYTNKIERLKNMLDSVSDDHMKAFATFKSDRALFIAHSMDCPQVHLRDMESDFGILPMPKWDEKQETYVSFMNAWVSGFVAIPQNADIEKSAFITEAMAYAGYETFRKPVYETTLKTKIARDEESERIIDIILETVYMDLNAIYNFGGTYDIVRNAIMDNKPFVSEYEKQENAMNNDIAKFIEATLKVD